MILGIHSTNIPKKVPQNITRHGNCLNITATIIMHFSEWFTPTTTTSGNCSCCRNFYRSLSNLKRDNRLCFFEKKKSLMLKATPCSQQKTIKNDKKTGVSENHAHNFTVKRMIIVLILPKVSLAFLLLAPLYLLYIYLVFLKSNLN